MVRIIIKWLYLRKSITFLFTSLVFLTSCGGDPSTLNIDSEVQSFCEKLVLERWNQDRDPTADDVWGCIDSKKGFSDEQGNIVHPKRYNYSDWSTVVP